MCHNYPCSIVAPAPPVACGCRSGWIRQPQAACHRARRRSLPFPYAPRPRRSPKRPDARRPLLCSAPAAEVWTASRFLSPTRTDEPARSSRAPLPLWCWRRHERTAGLRVRATVCRRGHCVTGACMRAGSLSPCSWAHCLFFLHQTYFRARRSVLMISSRRLRQFKYGCLRERDPIPRSDGSIFLRLFPTGH